MSIFLLRNSLIMQNMLTIPENSSGMSIFLLRISLILQSMLLCLPSFTIIFLVININYNKMATNWIQNHRQVAKCYRLCLCCQEQETHFLPEISVQAHHHDLGNAKCISDCWVPSWPFLVAIYSRFRQFHDLFENTNLRQKHYNL